jgi:Mrp family chromosome partitioning ATPase
MARIGKALQSAPKPEEVAADAAPEAERPDFKLVKELPLSAHEIVYTRTRSIDVSRELFRRNRIVSGFNPCLFTDAYKILSTQVSQKLRLNDWSTLGITSPGRGEGKTLTAINLAISLAAEFNQTALLVDADLRRPSVGDYFGLPQAPGLSDYLMSNVPIEQLLVHPGVAGFVFLPGGTPLLNSSEALGWRRMGDLVRELKARYPARLVVFDLPPLLHTADVLAFAPCLDAALLVVEEGKTARQDVERAIELLGSTHLLGTVLNKSTELKLPDDRPSGWVRKLLSSRSRAE